MDNKSGHHPKRVLTCSNTAILQTSKLQSLAIGAGPICWLIVIFLKLQHSAFVKEHEKITHTQKTRLPLCEKRLKQHPPKDFLEHHRVFLEHALFSLGEVVDLGRYSTIARLTPASGPCGKDRFKKQPFHYPYKAFVADGHQKWRWWRWSSIRPLPICHLYRNQ